MPGVPGRVSDDTVEMRRFEGNAHAVRRDPFVSIHAGSQQLQFNRAALETYPLDKKYANYYLADDGSQVGIKPVDGGDVDDKSYAFTYDTISFAGVATALGLAEIDNTIRLDVKWDSDEEMAVIDVSDLPRKNGD